MKAWPIHFNSDPNERIIAYQIFCPGCQATHELPLEKDNPYCPGKVWTFSGTVDFPSFGPSLVIKTGRYAKPDFIEDPECPGSVCHSIITAGNIQYLGDCTHELKNSTVSLPEI